MTLVPDRRDDGTNVLRLPAGMRLPLRVRLRLLPGPPGRSDAARAPRPCAAGPGPGLRRRLARRRRRARRRRPDDGPDAEPGARRPPVSRVPRRNEALSADVPPCGPGPAWPAWPWRPRRLAGACLAGARFLVALLARCAWPPSWPEPASWQPCLAGARFLAALRAGALGRLLRRSPLLGGREPAWLPSSPEPASWQPSCRSPLHGLPCRSPLDGLLGRRALRLPSLRGPAFLRPFWPGPFFLRLLPQVHLPRSMVTE